MRFLMGISWDVEAGNAIVRAGKLGEVVQSILAEQSRKLRTLLRSTVTVAASRSST
jgi:hypothetical protein